MYYQTIIKAVKTNNEIRKYFVINNKKPPDDYVKRRKINNQTKNKIKINTPFYAHIKNCNLIWHLTPWLNE